MTRAATATEALAELRRERRMRAEVYPRLVEAGRLTASELSRRTSALEAAIRIVERAAAAEIAPDLFGELR